MLKKRDGTIIAEKTEIKDSYLGKKIGMMFKLKPPENYAMIFKFKKEKKVNLHMLFVPFNIYALFLDKKNKVRKIKKMKAWTGRTKGKAQKIIEIPEKTYEGIEIEMGEKLLIKTTDRKTNKKIDHSKPKNQ